MSVGTEASIVEADPGNTGLELKDVPMYFGGIPESFDLAPFQKRFVLQGQ